MAIKLPKDAEGREIPLDTVALYDDDGNVHSVRRFIYTTDFDLGDKWINSWIAVVDDYKTAKPELMYLTPQDTWEKLYEDLSEAGDARYQEACAYFHRDKDEDGCVSCPGGEDGCGRIAMRDILARIRKLRGEGDA